MKPSKIDLDLLRRPDAFGSDTPFLEACLSPFVVGPVLPFEDGPLSGVLVDPTGVTSFGAETELTLCKDCLGSLHCGRVPDLALSNHMFLGEVPAVLKDLTVVEGSHDIIVSREMLYCST